MTPEIIQRRVKAKHDNTSIDLSLRVKWWFELLCMELDGCEGRASMVHKYSDSTGTQQKSFGFKADEIEFGVCAVLVASNRRCGGS